MHSDEPIATTRRSRAHVSMQSQYDCDAGEASLTEEELEPHEEEMRKRASLPWWKRPSPWWLVGILPFSSIATSSTIAAQIELITLLVCNVHKPDILPDLCKSDPVVQAKVAQLTAAITICLGVLSCTTTGWWGSFSDRHGRTRVMGISILGLLFTECKYIIVTQFSKYIPGGYWFLVVGAVIEGSLGGLATGVAAMNAYLADTSTEENRSRVLSLAHGLVFAGTAFGPTLGGLLIRFTGSTLSVFYAAAFIQLANSILVWTILPESLSRAKRDFFKEKYEREMRATRNSVGYMSRVFGFLTPLAVFLPSTYEVGMNPLKRERENRNLLLMALSFAFVLLVTGAATPEFQYAAATFNWSSEMLGYWLSLMGAARAVFLAIILPIIIKQFKPEPTVTERPANSPSETESLLSPRTSERDHSKSIREEVHSTLGFDLNIARISLIIDAAVYIYMGLTKSPTVFRILGMAIAMGSGFAPAMQSVTLALYLRSGGTESGKLFGAMSVLQALCSQIIGPSLYGLVYMKTVAKFPNAIFAVSVIIILIGLSILMLVRLPSDLLSTTPLVEEDIGEPERERSSANSVRIN